MKKSRINSEAIDGLDKIRSPEDRANDLSEFRIPIDETEDLMWVGMKLQTDHLGNPQIEIEFTSVAVEMTTTLRLPVSSTALLIRGLWDAFRKLKEST